MAVTHHKFKTIKAFEKFLMGMYDCVDRSEYTEDGYGVDTDQKLYLYYANGKHVGTWNRSNKANFTF